MYSLVVGVWGTFIRHRLEGAPQTGESGEASLVESFHEVFLTREDDLVAPLGVGEFRVLLGWVRPDSDKHLVDVAVQRSGFSGLTAFFERLVAFSTSKFAAYTVAVALGMGFEQSENGVASEQASARQANTAKKYQVPQVE